MEIIIKGSPFVKGGSCSQDDWHRRKDELHRERKEHISVLSETIFSKDKMNQRDCVDETQEKKRVQDYDKWKASKKNGLTNEERMQRFGEINREFKKHGEEGNPHNIDQIREKKIKFN
jgi:hypothetical protein